MPDDYRCVSKSDITHLTKICVGNSLFLMKMAQAISKGDVMNASSRQVDFNFKPNKQYCTIQIPL